MFYHHLLSHIGAAQLSIISVRFITVFFVCFDITSFFVQAYGGVLSTKKTADAAKNAKLILQVGFIIQLAGLALFSLVAYLTSRRMKRGGAATQQWQSGLRLLYVGVSMLGVRTLYRLLEMSITSNNGTTYPLKEDEWEAYVFDPAIIAPLAFLFLYWYPQNNLDGGSASLSEVKLTEDAEFQGEYQYDQYPPPHRA